MKARWVIAAVGLGLTGWMASASAQPYGGGGYGHGGGGYGGDYGGQDYRGRGGYEERDYGPPRRRGYAFDEGEYIRCNPDVRRALRNGQLTSAADHWRVFGQREGRRLSC